MAQHRISRVTEDIKRELMFIIPSLKDPRIAPMTSVVRVEVSNDLSYAKVYVSAIGGFQQAKESVKGLKSAAGYIRRELSARLHLRKMPEFTFIADDSIEHSADIIRKLNDLNIEEADEGYDDENI